MKLTSLNIQGFENWDNRKDAITTYIQQQDPEVVFFQEVVYIPDISDYTPVELLNQSLNYPYQINSISRLQVGLEYPVYREGLSLLSKYPVLKSDSIVLKKDAADAHNRILQTADLLVGESVVKVANIHLSITDVYDFATPQLQEVLDYFNARNETPIIMGDFNLSTLEDSEALWSEHYYASTSVPYISFPGGNTHTPKRIDYALIPKHYRFTSIAVSDDGLSDHRALTVSIEPNLDIQ